MFPTTIKRIILHLGLVLSVLIAWAAPLLFFNDSSSARVTDITASPDWYYHAGDLPSMKSAFAQNDAGWQPLGGEAKRAALPGPGYYWLKINIHDRSHRDPHLFIYDLRHYEVYWDGRRLFESNFDHPRPWTLEYYDWNLVSLPFGYALKPVLLRVYSEDGSIHTGTVEVGNAADFIIRILHKDGDLILFGVIFTLLFVVAALFYFNTKKKMYLYFSLLAFCAGYASIFRTFALGIFLDVPELIFLHELMLPLGAFAFHGFFEQLTGGTDRLRRSVRYLMLLFTGICLAAGLWDANLYHELIYYVFPALFVVMIGTSLRMLARTYRGRRNTESAVMIVGYTASTVTTLLSSCLLIFPELRVYLAGHMPLLTPYVRDDQLPIFIGLFIFLCCMGAIVMMREKEVHRQVQSYAGELEDKNRKLEQIDKVKDEFLANTSHELRTPLYGIIGITESLLEGVAGPLNEMARSNLAMVVSSGKRLSRLINDILDFSKLKHTGVSLFIQGVDVKRTADSVRDVLQPLAHLKDIRLANLIDERLPLAAADENRVQQILYNLVGNALKFTEHGHVEIAAHVDNGWIYISVSDSGIGIPADRLEAIFEPFEQGEGSAAREFEGAGLGLAISRRLVDLHGGTLGVRSSPGRGSTFTFTLPAAEEVHPGHAVPAIDATSAVTPTKLARGEALPLVTASQAAAAAEEAADDSPSAQERAVLHRQTCVLLVDDDPVNLQVLTNFLSTRPYTILKASNGAEAIRLLEEGARPDLVLTDLMMPRMTGYELCRKIRERYKPSEMPIIVLSAKNQVTDLVEGFDAGANDYLVKPVSKRELLARIEMHLQLAGFAESLERRVQERTEALEETNRQLQAAMRETAEAVAEASVLEERNRISFDIHNTVGHTLTACIAQMEAAKMLIARGQTEQALPKLDTSRELVSKGLYEIRQSIRMLKLETTDEDVTVSLLRLIRETEHSAGVRIEADIHPLPPLGSTQKRTLYHALLEGLTNGIRHGKSRSFTFRLTHGNGRIHFRLANDGHSVNEESSYGFGLSAMEQNIRQLGGDLTLESAGDRGAVLSIDIPLDWRAQSRYVEQSG